MTTWTKIYNPLTKRYNNLSSKEGRRTLKHYLYYHVNSPPYNLNQVGGGEEKVTEPELNMIYIYRPYGDQEPAWDLVKIDEIIDDETTGKIYNGILSDGDFIDKIDINKMN